MGYGGIDMQHLSIQPNLGRLKSRLAECGYVALTRWCPDSTTSILAPAIGSIEQIPGIPQVQILRPKGREKSTPNLYSGNFGRDEFPLHTDLAHWFIPPRYFMLRCVKGDARAFTAVLPWRQVLRSMAPVKILRARFRARTPVRGRAHLLAFAQRVESNVLHRWDGLFLVPDNDAAMDVASSLKALTAQTTRAVTLERPGDTLIVDNWRVLHGRSAVPEDSDRVIERVYLRELYNHG